MGGKKPRDDDRDLPGYVDDRVAKFMRRIFFDVAPEDVLSTFLGEAPDSELLSLLEEWLFSVGYWRGSIRVYDRERRAVEYWHAPIAQGTELPRLVLPYIDLQTRRFRRPAERTVVQRLWANPVEQPGTTSLLAIEWLLREEMRSGGSSPPLVAIHPGEMILLLLLTSPDRLQIDDLSSEAQAGKHLRFLRTFDDAANTVEDWLEAHEGVAVSPLYLPDSFSLRFFSEIASPARVRRWLAEGRSCASSVFETAAKTMQEAAFKDLDLSPDLRQHIHSLRRFHREEFRRTGVHGLLVWPLLRLASRTREPTLRGSSPVHEVYALVATQPDVRLTRNRTNAIVTTINLLFHQSVSTALLDAENTRLRASYARAMSTGLLHELNNLAKTLQNRAQVHLPPDEYARLATDINVALEFQRRLQAAFASARERGSRSIRMISDFISNLCRWDDCRIKVVTDPEDIDAWQLDAAVEALALELVRNAYTYSNRATLPVRIHVAWQRNGDSDEISLTVRNYHRLRGALVLVDTALGEVPPDDAKVKGTQLCIQIASLLGATFRRAHQGGEIVACLGRLRRHD